MNPLKKLPPDVAKELLRHVSPRPLRRAADTSDRQAAAKLFQKQQQDKRPGAGKVAAGLVIFTGTMFAVPFALQQWIGSLNERDDPLTPSQTRRGAFNNSGSRDAGKDPAWDFRKGQYKKDDNYWAIFDDERNLFGSVAGAGKAGGDDTAKRLREQNEAALKKSQQAMSGK